MQCALGEQRIVLTHNLDYGAMLAATKSHRPQQCDSASPYND